MNGECVKSEDITMTVLVRLLLHCEPPYHKKSYSDNNRFCRISLLRPLINKIEIKKIMGNICALPLTLSGTVINIIAFLLHYKETVLPCFQKAVRSVQLITQFHLYCIDYRCHDSKKKKKKNTKRLINKCKQTPDLLNNPCNSQS